MQIAEIICTDCLQQCKPQRKKLCNDKKFRCKKCGHLRRNRKYAKSEKGKKYQKEYTQKNSINKIKLAKIWAKNNPKRRKEIEKKYSLSEKGKKSTKKIQRKRYWTDPEYYRIKAKSRIHNTTPEVLKNLFEKQTHCQLCKSTHNISVDHIFPISKGGKTIESNLQILCISCNSFKKDRLMLANFNGVII